MFLVAYRLKQADAAHRLVAILRAERMRRVFDHPQVVPLGDLHDGRHVARLAGKMHRDDGFGARRDRRLYPLRIDVQRVGLHVDEDRRRPDVHDDVDGRGKREGRGDHLVTGSDTDGKECQVERRRARVQADRVSRPAEPCDRRFQLECTASLCDPAGAQGVDDRLLFLDDVIFCFSA